MADKQKDVKVAEDLQKETIRQVGVMENSLKQEETKLKLATETIEKNELDFMTDL